MGLYKIIYFNHFEVIIAYQDLNCDSDPVHYEAPKPMQPLRYTPGLKCDPALEALRPERDMKHQALQVVFYAIRFCSNHHLS